MRGGGLSRRSLGTLLPQFHRHTLSSPLSLLTFQLYHFIFLSQVKGLDPLDDLINNSTRLNLNEELLEDGDANKRFKNIKAQVGTIATSTQTHTTLQHCDIASWTCMRLHATSWHVQEGPHTNNPSNHHSNHGRSSVRCH